MPEMNFTQKSWLVRMERTLQHLHNQWYGYDGHEVVHSKLDEGLLADTDNKIRLACERLGIQVEEADPVANDWWDGEMYEPIVTLQDALRAIRKHFGLPQWGMPV